MRSLFDLPFLEALYEARVWFDAGPVLLYKRERKLVRHAMAFDEIGDDDGRAAGDALLAVDEHILPCRERLFDPCASVVEVGLEVSRGDVHDVDPGDGHVWVVDGGEPWDVDDLDEVGDAVFPEQISVGDGSE